MNFAYFHKSFLHKVSDYVKLVFIVFGFMVGPWLLSLVHSAAIITIELHWDERTRYHTKLGEELLYLITLLRI